MSILDSLDDDYHLPSNCYSKRQMHSIDGATIHFISAKNILPDDPFNLEAIIGIFKTYKVSAKYLIRRSGELIELTPGNHKQYHAGRSRMNGRDGCNNFTIGIELEGGIGFDYTDAQLITLAEVLTELMVENQFTLDWVQGHSKIRNDWIAAYPEKAIRKKVSKKYDPGKHFPWERLREMLAGVSASVEVANV